MRGAPASFTAWTAALAGAVLLPLSAALAARLHTWMTIESERFGYSLAYPGSVFTADNGRAGDEGHVLVSHDGRARLLAAAFPNTEETSLEDYRAYLLKNNYPGATLDYAPIRKKWFVLSGTRDGTMFYERVSFTCGGRLINSWAVLYPATERRLYDRVIEVVARSYAPGAGRDGTCDLGST